MDTLLLPTKFAPLYVRAPIRLRQGVVLIGPPGCGKTFLVKAAVTKLSDSVRFFVVKGPELLSKYIGESEAGVRRVFEQAKSVGGPSCIFFDEIEALCPKRGGGGAGGESSGVTDRVVNQMLTYLDGVEARNSLYVVAATGRPDMVDPALLRPGRLDRVIYCGIPKMDEKVRILQTIASAMRKSPTRSGGGGGISRDSKKRKYNLSKCAKRFLGIYSTHGGGVTGFSRDSPDSSCDSRAKRATGATGCGFAATGLDELKGLLHKNLIPADLNAIFSTAQLKAIHACLDAEEGGGGGDENGNASSSSNTNSTNSSNNTSCTTYADPPKPRFSKPTITKDILIEAIAETKTSFSDRDVMKYERQFEEYRSEAGKTDAAKTKVSEMRAGKQRTMLG